MTPEIRNILEKFLFSIAHYLYLCFWTKFILLGFYYCGESLPTINATNIVSFVCLLFLSYFYLIIVDHWGSC